MKLKSFPSVMSIHISRRTHFAKSVSVTLPRTVELSGASVAHNSILLSCHVDTVEHFRQFLVAFVLYSAWLNKIRKWKFKI